MAKQTFQVGVEFLANVSDLQNKIKTVTGDIAKMGSSSGGTQVQKQFDRLTQSVQNLQTRAQQPITSQGEFNRLVSDLNRAEGAYDSLISALDRMRSMSNSQKLELLPADEQAKIQKAAQAIQVFDAEAKKAAGSADKLAAANARVVEAQNKATGAKNAWKSISKEYDAAKSKLDQLKAVSLQVGQAQSKLDDAVASGAGEQEIATLRLSLEQAKAAAEKLGVEFQEGVSPVNTMKAAVQNLGTEVTKLGTKKTNLGKDYETAKANVTNLKKELTTLEGQLGKTGSTTQLEQAFERLKSKAKELGVDVKGIDDAGQIDELKNRLMQFQSQGVERADTSIRELSGSLQGELKNGLNSTRQGLDQAANSFDKFNSQAQEVEQLKSQLGYFFSLTNSVYLLRSALQSAFNTVKELDAVMTETAVVTTNSVGDMWEKLPQYAAAADQLGSSIKDVYAATTLYYQQGLKDHAAMTVGIETMKMARIANMDAAEATQAMTAALRGFNMEVNQTNALRVNDVYSNLAAITAADTEQIATAMSKTASIAASANMEFETTAALLAQIIETTQEAPETAGTALKTIIARFSEVKELQNKGKTTGEDEEGESIDVNKIDKALSSVGISMDAFFAGTEGLDQVLMRLAEKWDTLDFTTQRYIATMAAGSRQQSRFIAMMSDYSRTTELVSAANNSAGASQKQFDKTMESLEAKLNRLKVAWDQFTMNIADDGLIKMGIDLLTDLLNTINKITGDMPGVIRSFANLGLVFVALRIGGALLNKALAGISGIVAKGFVNAGVVAAKTAETSGEVAGAKMTLGAAKGVNNPVAQAGLFKSYNLLLFKLQSTLPPIQLKATTNPAAVREYQSSLQSLRMEMNKVAIAKGKDSAEWKALNAQYQQMLANPVKLAASYSIEGAAVDGLTLKQRQLLGEKVKEGTITKTQIALMGPEAAGRVADALAAGKEEKEIRELNWAKQTEENLRKGGIVGFLTEVGLRLMNITTTKGEKAAKQGLIPYLWQEFTARMANNSAMLIGLGYMLAIVAAVALLIVGIVQCVKAWKNADISKELEKINDQISEFSTLTQEASEGLSKITEQKNNLKEMENTLAGLTEGSREWKQQLLEINGTVLSLMQTYPDLAKYIVRGSNGQLSISEEGWDYVYDAQYEQYNSATQGSIGAQIQKNQLNSQKAFEEAQNQFAQTSLEFDRFLDSQEGQNAVGTVSAGALGLTGAIAGGKIGATIGSGAAPGWGTAIGALAGLLVGGLAGYFGGSNGAKVLGKIIGEEEIEKMATGGLVNKDYNSFAAAAAEKGMTVKNTSKAEFRDLFKSMGLDQKANFEEIYKKMLQLGENFDQLGIESAKLEAAQEHYVNTLLNAAADGDDVLANDKFRDYIIEGHNDVQEDLPETIEKYAEEFKNNDEYVDKKGKATDKLISEYAEAAGMTEDQVRAKIKDESLSVDTMTTQLATKKATDQSIEDMKKTSQALQELEKRLGGTSKEFKGLLGVLSAEGKDLTRAQLDDVVSTINKKLPGKNYKSIEEITALSDPKAREEAVNAYLSSMGQSLDDLGLDADTFLENWKIADNSFASGDKIAEQLGINWQAKQSSSGSYNTIMQNLDAIGTGSTTQQKQQLMEYFNKLLPTAEDGSVDQEQASKMADALASINWTSIESIEGLSSKLEELGISIPANEIEDFEDRLKDVANASSEIDLEKVRNTIQTITGAFDQSIETGSNTIAQAVYDELSTDAKKYFTWTQGGWVFDNNNKDGKTFTDVMGSEQKDYLSEATKGHEENWRQVQGTEERTEGKTYKTKTATGTHEMGEDIFIEDTYDDFALGKHFKGAGYGVEGNISGGNMIVDWLQWRDDTVTSNPDYANSLVYGGNFAEFLSSQGVIDSSLLDPDIWNAKTDEEKQSHWADAVEKGYQDYVKSADAKGVDATKRISEEDWKDMFSWTKMFGNEAIGYNESTGKWDFSGLDGKYVNAITNGTGIEVTNATGRYTTTVKEGGAKTAEEIITEYNQGKIFGEDSDEVDKGHAEDFNETSNFVTKNEALRIYADVVGEAWSGSADATATEILDAASNHYNTYAGQKEKFEQELTDEETQQEYITYFGTLSATELANYEATNPGAQLALDKATSAKIAGENLEGVEADLKNSLDPELVEEYADEVRSLTILYGENQKKLSKLSSVFEKHQKSLTAAKRGTYEYNTSLSQLANSISTTFGISLTVDFLKKYPELVEQMIQGGEAGAQAWKQIMTDWRNETMKTNGKTTAQIQQFNNEINSLPTEVGVMVTGRTEGLTGMLGEVQQVGDMMVWSSKNAELFQKQMALTHGEVAFDYVWIKDGKVVDPNTEGAEKFVTGYSFTATDIKSPFSNVTNSGGTKWKNEHDKQYNNYEKINRLLREREQIERQYDRLLKKRGVSYKDLLKNQQEQLQNLKNQAKTQEAIKSGKAQEIQDLLNSKEGKKYKDYVSYDAETGQISIDWDEVNKLKGEKGEGFDEFLSQLEGLRDQWQESQDALDEIMDNTDEVLEQGKDDYFDLEDKIKEALIADRQKEIDKLTDINDSINDTNSKILESLQEQVDEYRQNRDNEKTEEELSDKQRRLAYLQQDTSGANATEILSLQKEIEEGQESYTDQLIDQKISELQKQNDEAAEQRERQISLLESQLDWYEESGAVWNDVYDLMNSSDSFLSDGALNPDGPLGKLLKENENFAGMSKLGQIDWWQEISAIFANAILYSKTGRRAQEGEKIRFQDAQGNWHEGVADKNGNITVDGKTFTGVHQNERGQWVTDEKQGETPKEDTEHTHAHGQIASLPNSTKLSRSQVKALQSGLNKLLEEGRLRGYPKLDIDGNYGILTKQAVRALQNAIGIPSSRQDGVWGPETAQKFKTSDLKAYKTGGLADFTGPAWLDGTKSKPEYVLNADQTKAFFTLVDILSGLTAGTAKSSEKTGDTSYDIDINVESIGSDYDVEQIANKIKSLINEDARYRNNNAINLMR